MRRVLAGATLVAMALGSGAAAADPGDPLSAPDSSALARAGRMTKNFVSDLGYVAASPARVHRAGFVRPLAILATGAVLFAYDQEIAAGFHRSEENGVYDAAIGVGEALDPLGYTGRTLPYHVGLAVAGAALRAEPVQRVGLEIVESHLISGGIRNAAKLAIGRRREHEGRSARAFELNGGTSFPSGHTSAVFQLATILSHEAKSTPVTVLLYGAAAGVGLERVHSKSHWPSDVFFSAIEGTLVARTVLRRNQERRAAEAPRLSVMPGGRGVAVTWLF